MHLVIRDHCLVSSSFLAFLLLKSNALSVEVITFSSDIWRKPPKENGLWIQSGNFILSVLFLLNFLSDANYLIS